MYFASAPIIVVSGNIIFSSPLYLAHAFIAANIPDEIDSTYPSTPVICPAKNIFELFFKLYVLKQGFRDGYYGLVMSVMAGIYDLVKYLKLYNMYANNQKAGD